MSKRKTLIVLIFFIRFTQFFRFINLNIVQKTTFKAYKN